MKPCWINLLILFGILSAPPMPGDEGLPHQPVWQAVAPLPTGLAGFASGKDGPTLVVAGGTRWEADQKLTSRTTLAYDAALDRWTEIAPLPRGFAFGPFGVHAGQLFMIGGDDGVRTHADAVRPAATLALPEPVAYAGSAILNGRLYVLGGTTNLRELDHAHGHFHALDLASGDAERLPEFPDGPAIHVSLVALGDHLLAFTGGKWDTAARELRNSAATWRYHPDIRTWEPLAPYPFAARAVAVCALDNRYVLLAGGYRSGAGDDGVTAACFVFDSANNRYLPVSPLPLAAMAVVLVRDGDVVYALGGEDRPRSRSAMVLRADIRRLLREAEAGPGRQN